MNAKWLRLSEEINAIDYLYRAYYFIKQTEKDKTAWKWVVISLFGALYGFAICTLKGTSSLGVIDKNGRLIYLGEAIKRCQDPRFMNMTVMSKCLTLTNEQEESIRRLKNVLRNRFEHFFPMSWLIEIHGLPKISLDVLDVIHFLALETGNYTCLNFSQMKKIKSYIYQSKKILKQSRLYKEIKIVNKNK